MRYNFSVEYLRIKPPDTSFADAWESLCFALLAADGGTVGLQHLRAPDSGIDILRKGTSLDAFQCKSDERGACGSLSSEESIKSLNSAFLTRQTLHWDNYIFATNANYTGKAVLRIAEEASRLGVGRPEFLGPEHWNALCCKYPEQVGDRFDFRVTVTEEQVVEAFRKARYYDEYIRQFAEQLSQKKEIVTVKNNWTPLEIQLPFSADFKVEECLRVVQQHLGIDLAWTNMNDLGTSTSPSISLTINKRALPFNITLAEAREANGSGDLVFWITIRWKCQEAADDPPRVMLRTACPHDKPMALALLSESERQRLTVERAESLIQGTIWASAAKLRTLNRIANEQ